jgi:hypothetical protein
MFFIFQVTTLTIWWFYWYPTTFIVCHEIGRKESGHGLETREVEISTAIEREGSKLKRSEWLSHQ